MPTTATFDKLQKAASCYGKRMEDSTYFLEVFWNLVEKCIENAQQRDALTSAEREYISKWNGPDPDVSALLSVAGHVMWNNTPQIGEDVARLCKLL
jgi:hypothetical protein